MISYCMEIYFHLKLEIGSAIPEFKILADNSEGDLLWGSELLSETHNAFCISASLSFVVIIT